MEQVALLRHYIGAGVTLFNLTLFCFFSISPITVADPDPRSGIWYSFDPLIRDPGWEKNPDPGSGIFLIRDPGRKHSRNKQSVRIAFAHRNRLFILL
jgi:hypothetical protein